MIEDERGKLLRMDEVAARLRVSVRRVRMIPASELPYAQLETRGRRAYRVGDIERYLDTRTVRA